MVEVVVEGRDGEGRGVGGAPAAAAASTTESRCAAGRTPEESLRREQQAAAGAAHGWREAGTSWEGGVSVTRRTHPVACGPVCR
jgi:hypothetical protein